MTLRLYCLIHTVLIAMACAGVDQESTEEYGNINNKRKCPYLYDEHGYTKLAAAKRLKPDLVADKLGKLARADIDKKQLPHFARAFGKNVGLYEYSQFGTFVECPSSQVADIRDEKGGMIFSRNVCNDIHYDVSTSMSPEDLSNNAPGHGQANPKDSCTTVYRNQTQNPSQTESHSYINPNYYSYNSFGAFTTQLGVQSITDNETADQIANLLINTKWHEVPVDKLEFLNKFGTVERKFNELLKGYNLLWQRNNQKNRASKFNFGVTERDLKTHGDVLKSKSEEILDHKHKISVSRSIIYVPDFKTYYERCKAILACTTNKYIIFSQGWSNTRENEGSMLLYMEIATAIANLPSAVLRSNIICIAIRKICDKYFLETAHVLKKFNGKARYYPANYIPQTKDEQEKTDLYVPIDVTKYIVANAKDYEEKFAIFKQFIFNIFFGKHPSRAFYTIKEELWSLQMYMPEIYFYLTWRLKITNDISVGFGNEEYGLKEEIENLADLVGFLIIQTNNLNMNGIIANNMRVKVNEFRSKILVMLKNHFESSAVYQFYRLAHTSEYKNGYNNFCLRNRDIISIIAFAQQLESYEELVQLIINFGKNDKAKNNKNTVPKLRKEDSITDVKTKEVINEKKDGNTLRKEKNKKKNEKPTKKEGCTEKHLTLSDLSNGYLGSTLKHKFDLIKTLQCLVKFIKEIKPFKISKQEEEEKVLLVALDGYTVIISMRTDHYRIDVRVLTKADLYVYFYHIIYSMFAEQ